MLKQKKEIYDTAILKPALYYIQALLPQEGEHCISFSKKKAFIKRLKSVNLTKICALNKERKIKKTSIWATLCVELKASTPFNTITTSAYEEVGETTQKDY